MSHFPKLTFSAYTATNEGNFEIDWIEKKQLIQDFRKLSIDDKPCVNHKIRASTASPLDLPFHKLRISCTKGNSRRRKNLGDKEKTNSYDRQQNFISIPHNLQLSKVMGRLLRKNHDLITRIVSNTPTTENAIVPVGSYKADYSKEIILLKQIFEKMAIIIIEQEENKEQEVEIN